MIPALNERLRREQRSPRKILSDRKPAFNDSYKEM